jgi:hypothetical protein
MKYLYYKKLIVLVMVIAFGMSLAEPVVAMAAPKRFTNHDKTVTSGEVHRALQNTPGLLDDTAGGRILSDVDSALTTTAGTTAVDVPKQARHGVYLADAQGTSLTVSLPNAAAAGTAQSIVDGVVSYPANNGSSNAVQANADGSVRMLTVIDNPAAPTRYDYTMTLPSGASMKEQLDGSISIVNAQSVEIASIAKPWAKDVVGNRVPTYYVITGNTLRQIVDHTAHGVTYPITADPSISLGWRIYIKLNRAETKHLASRSNQSGFYYGLPGAAGCYVIGNGFIGWVCGGFITWRTSQLLDALDRAAATNNCIQAGLPYGVYNPATFWASIYSTNFATVRC